jgi:hypothetical protein
MTEKEESKLEELKKNYIVLQEKYNLPSFDELNRDFQIEKVAESESDFLIREIRKAVSEKPYTYLRFVETLINPVNAPMSILSVVKTLGSEEKDKLTEIYKKLVRNEVLLIETDINFSEETEVKFIKETYEMWKSIKKDFADVLSIVNKNWDNKTEINGKKYFG